MDERIDKAADGFAYWEARKTGSTHEEALAALNEDELSTAEEKAGVKRAIKIVDEVLVKGEGVLSDDQFPDDSATIWHVHPGLYKWIRVYRNGQNGKAIATFYLHTLDGVLQEMFLARARKKLPPNPLDSVELATYKPRFVKYFYEEANGLWREDRAVIDLAKVVRPDHLGSQGVKDLRPTLRVKMIPSPDGDHRWQFPGLKVRSSKLAPVLLAFRNEGIKRVTISDIQQGLNRI